MREPSLDIVNSEPASNAEAGFVLPRETYSSTETLLLFHALERRLDTVANQVSDHAQRFDTLQTPWPKRIWFAINGWPWYDLNADRPKWRPWHRWVKP